MPPKSSKAKTKVKALPIDVITEPVPSENVVIQLQISKERLNTLTKGVDQTIVDPEAYNENNDNNFISSNDIIDELNSCEHKQDIACYWCCHSIASFRIGMPVLYSPFHGTFTTFGNFCSLECTVAYNFATNQGSDRVWEIHSWINLMARKMGLPNPVRPAPSRFLLKMFGGPMSIDDFRNAHKSMSRTFVINIPPLISLNPQTEVINTSYIASPSIVDIDKVQDRMKISRAKSVVDHTKTLDCKMNITYGSVISTSS